MYSKFASLPLFVKNGVIPVAECLDVLYASCAIGNKSVQLSCL